MLYFCTEDQDILKLKAGKERCYSLQSHGVKDTRGMGKFYFFFYTGVRKSTKSRNKKKKKKENEKGLWYICMWECLHRQEREITTLKIAFTPFQNIKGKSKKENKQVTQPTSPVAQESYIC